MCTGVLGAGSAAGRFKGVVSAVFQFEQGETLCGRPLRWGGSRGVRIGVHWSVLLIFGIIAFGLAQGRLPRVFPGHTPVV
jgi:hypothetical protein